MIRQISQSLSEYMHASAEAAKKTDFGKLAETVSRIIACRQRGGVVYTAGNGGSAATASHMANDLIKGCRVGGRSGVRAHCLCDSTAVLTCLANDFSYEDALAIAFGTLAKKGDMLVVFSGSGNSENIVRCVSAAGDMDIETVAFTGRDGGRLKDMCDVSVIAPSHVMEIIEDIHMMQEHAMVTEIRGRLSRIWDIEVIRPKKTQPTAALFDFDGTVSLIREGWQSVMIPYFTEVLLETPGGQSEGEKAAAACTRDFIDMLTGKQTIFQCERLNSEVIKRGGEHRDPYLYKKEYLRRLDERISHRLKGLTEGDIAPEQLTVAGFRAYAEQLRAQGIKCYLASGTDEENVIMEAELLGVARLFDGGIYGARDEIKSCSKEIVIKKILKENNISGEDLISFGDGYVEIELVADIGGYAVGVAADEEFLIEKAAGCVPAGECRVDEWKRARLIKGGASAIIPDFTGYIM
ncbi:MAG: SIS domain-containing protein [Eubacteriales bacterium]|jgi:phosphoheptose isomerase/phosphoglycolate phosphatase-like HAD superfamily hydrolase|nr:SIS domain-containing protein [Eubacteriales bacterium]